MLRAMLIGAVLASASTAMASEISGIYLESRTCQVYTGPCFANSEVGLTGKDAIMAWSIENGKKNGVDLAGLNVVVVLTASETLGFRGLDGVERVKSVVVVDDRADSAQREALVAFAREHAGRAGKAMTSVTAAPIKMSLDIAELNGRLEAGNTVKLSTRKAEAKDCICSHEDAYYPPLARVTNFVPGVTVKGGYSGRGLGSRWTTDNDRNAFMATFVY